MAKGLPDVTQKVGMDADKYFAEGDKVIDKNVELGDSSDDLAAKFERNQMMVDAFAIRLGELRDKLARNQGEVKGFAAALGEMQNKLISAQAAQEKFNSTEATLDRLSAAYENFNDRQEKAYATALQTGAILKDQASAYKSVGDALTYGVLDSFERVKNQQDASLMTLKQLKAAQEDLAVQITQTGSEAAISGAKTKQAFADYHEGATRAIALTRQLAQESSLLAAGGNFGGGGTAAALTTLRGGGDGSGAAAAFLGDVFGGGGGGGGGGLMTAAEYANNITAFTKRWAAAAHYAVMGTMEALSTIVPATVALGGAAEVSIQAGEQIANRGQAIMGTAEALGSRIRAHGRKPGRRWRCSPGRAEQVQRRSLRACWRRDEPCPTWTRRFPAAGRPDHGHAGPCHGRHGTECARAAGYRCTASWRSGRRHRLLAPVRGYRRERGEHPAWPGSASAWRRRGLAEHPGRNYGRCSRRSQVR